MFYAFNDNTINGKSYTMHLNISPLTGILWNHLYAKVGVELFSITPEFYKFITSLNDADNNVLAEVGLLKSLRHIPTSMADWDFSEVTV